jgi:anti-anti-sigma factor
MLRTKIKIGRHQNEPLIEILGHWQQSTLDLLFRAFQKCVSKAQNHLFLRASELDYLDSAGIGLILINARELGTRNIKLVLLQPSEEIRKALQIIHLDGILEIQD